MSGQASDVLVIGGGIAGLSAGAALADGGARVTLLEAEGALGYHASGRSAALWEPGYGNPAIRALTEASEADLSDFLSARGLLMVATVEEKDLFETDLLSMGLTRIPVSQAHDLCPILDPDVVAMAAASDRPKDIDTARLLETCARSIRRGGGEILLNAAVSRLYRTDAEWVVATFDREWRATCVVNAAGPWADRVARMAGIDPLGLVPHRRSMARIALPGGVDPGRWPMLFGPGESWYAKPDAGALIVSPADEVACDPHDAWAQETTLAEGIADYEARVTVPVTRMLANWAGLRTFAPDRALVIGSEARAHGFYWSAGQGGYGFQTAPAAGRLLADLVLGRQSLLDPATIAALSPARFRPGA